MTLTRLADTAYSQPQPSRERQSLAPWCVSRDQEPSSSKGDEWEPRGREAGVCATESRKQDSGSHSYREDVDAKASCETAALRVCLGTLAQASVGALDVLGP